MKKLPAALWPLLGLVGTALACDSPPGSFHSLVTEADLAGAVCNDDCYYSGNYTCEEARLGGSGYCEPGTDCSDCGAYVPPTASGGSGTGGGYGSGGSGTGGDYGTGGTSTAECSNTCYAAGNGVCDDGGLYSTNASCSLGTDCTDCGPRHEEPTGCGSCPTHDNGVCDEGYGCDYGTDCNDCAEEPASELCTNDCQFAGDGVCDDLESYCSYGSDCSDCGVRTY